MKKILNKDNIFLIFLAFFSISIGVFNNYRELWLTQNGLTVNSIGNINCFASIITVLLFLFFTIKVSPKILKKSISLCLILKMITCTGLVCLNNSNNLFLIKFLVFFEIAFNELILASIYPLILNISNSDLMYTKKETIESICSKIAFFIVSIFLGMSIGNFVFDYNKCLLLSIIFTFIAFLILINLNCNINNNEEINIKETFNYLNNHKIIYEYLICNTLSSLVWATILGLPLLSLTKNIGFSTQFSSLLILIMGVITNILAMLIVKYFKFKNDNINMIFKYGIRLILYLLVFIFNNKILLIVTFIYLLLFDMPYNFIFNSYFLNKVPNKYTFLIITLKYCTTLIGNGIGILICGLIFNFEIRYLVLPALIFGIFHYLIGSHIISKRNKITY